MIFKKEQKILLTIIILLSLAGNVGLVFGSAIFNGPNGENRKLVSLTFDDGPYGNSTIQILDILKAKKVKATFFVVGKNVQKYPEVLKREIKEGHVIGNHSFSHSMTLAHLGPRKLKDDILAADSSIFSAVGLHPKFFRPPYGLRSYKMINFLERLGYMVVMWDDATADWDKNRPSEKIIEMVIKELKPGAIIDLHDGRDVQVDYSRENLIKALSGIIDQARSLGYTFVTLDKLIGQEPYFSSK